MHNAECKEQTYHEGETMNKLRRKKQTRRGFEIVRIPSL